MDAKTLLDYLFSLMKESPSSTNAFEKIYWTFCESNVTDEIKTILLSQQALNTFQTHLKIWTPDKPPIKAITENLKLILLMSDKISELNYGTLSQSGYFTEVLNIYFGCLKYLTETNQEEIDENCNLSLVLSSVSKYAVKFYLKDKTNNTISCVSQLFFKKALNFLIYKGYEFAKNPNNCVYILILTNTLYYLISLDNIYKSLFVEMNGIHYCLDWLSKSYKDKMNFFQKLFYDLRILSILENFVDNQYIFNYKSAVASKLVKYLRFNGESILRTSFMRECDLVFGCICNIFINMAMKVEGSRQELGKYHVKQLMLSYLSKYRMHAKTIYATILALEENSEAVTSSENENIMNMDIIMGKWESLSYVLSLPMKYNISLPDY